MIILLIFLGNFTVQENDWNQKETEMKATSHLKEKNTNFKLAGFKNGTVQEPYRMEEVDSDFLSVLVSTEFVTGVW